MPMSIDERLATYGTLAPGRVNHHHLADLTGRWILGSVTGHLVQRGWGATLGYPALIPAPDGTEVEVHLSSRPTCPTTGAASTPSRAPNTAAPELMCSRRKA
jgi:gamma-glutamylcyclotransferase (GGCT)/AIG2-like uncharacterized protein YtfP